MDIKKTFAALICCFIAQSAYATFNAQDPRALGMGGTSVAAGNTAQAHLYNPSLLASPMPEEDFNFEIFGAIRLADPDNLTDSFSDFGKEKYFSVFADSLTAMNDFIAKVKANPLDYTDSEKDSVALGFKSATENLQNAINALSNKSIISEFNAGIMTSDPREGISWAVYFNYWIDAGGTLNVDDRDNNELNTRIGVIDTVIAATDATDIDVVSLFNPIDSLYSNATIEGMAVQEIGIALAMPYAINNYSFDVGITPKFMSIKTYSYIRSLEQSEENNEIIDLSDSKDYSSVNLDLGLSKKLTENWKSGLTIKNLIPQSFETSKGTELNISPELRLGTSYQNNWATVALDFDLTENEAPASGSKSRYLAVGTELDAWLAKVRLGYRANLASSNNNIASVGLGLYLLGLNIDAAVAQGQGETGPNDLNGAIQIGLQW